MKTETQSENPMKTLHPEQRKTMDQERSSRRVQSSGTLPLFLSILLLLLVLVPEAQTYPPAPHHLLYGTVRDELGNPLTDNAEVIFQSDAGTIHRILVSSDLPPGTNYELKIPMDAGLTSELYQPTALRPTVPFKIHVKLGSRVYLPIEMVANFASLGQPGKKTRIDLTLGEDTDGDGLPDAWERALMKPGQTLADINPGDDTDGDGMSNRAEYLTGNYAFDDSNGFTLKVSGLVDGNAKLDFTVVRGRTYTVYGSADLKSWQVLPFKVDGVANDVPAQSALYATDIRPVSVIVQPGDLQPRYFRLMAQ